MDKTNKTDGTEGKMIVFLKTSEEALCVPNDTCHWTYSANIPEVHNMSTLWDSATATWQVVVEGVNFTGSVNTTELNVDG